MTAFAEEEARNRRTFEEFAEEEARNRRMFEEAPATFSSRAFNLLLRVGLSQRKALYLSCHLEDMALAQYAGDAAAAKRVDELTSKMLQHEIPSKRRRRR
jgi:hypothetical protein